MGGRAAEEVVFSEVTTGAANDFDQATRIAKAMVVEYGMSSLGPVNYGPTMDITEWGRAYFEQNTISNEMLAKIDNEVKKIVEQCFTQAKKLISLNREKLNLVAEQLLIKESLDDDEFIKIVGTKKETTLKS